ncbi:protein kinase [Streptomyces sp. NPDC003077]|uniref:serine/threonine-protein kinase n=1 Tax=Streptomyces sp. NPDC003077 TaxID=3154443 RepID=UPI0033AA64C9
MATRSRLIADRYRLARRLGVVEGRTLWLARDEDLGDDVTLTEFPPPSHAGAPDPAGHSARVRAWAEDVGRLREHPGIVGVYGAVEHEGTPWVVTAHVPEAVDLWTRVRRTGGLPPEEIGRVASAILDALSAGHHMGVLHRALSPSAVLLAPDPEGGPYGRVLLTGYGMGPGPGAEEDVADDTPERATALGFRAPECVRSSAHAASPASDLFSLGAVLYAAAEGHGPFAGRDARTVEEALLHATPAPPERAGELASLIRQLLIKDPMRRATAGTVRRALDEARGDLGAGPPDEPAGPKAPGPEPPRQGPQVTHVPAESASEGPDEAPDAATATAPGPILPTDRTDTATGPWWRRGRRRLAVLLAAVAVVVLGGGAAAVAVFVVGDSDGSGDGTGEGKAPAASRSASSPAGGSGFPYGSTVGLTTALTPGDCLRAVWTGAVLKSVPNVGVVDCVREETNAQVVATLAFPDARSARDQAPAQCTQQAASVAGRLPDAGTYALVPTDEGFAAARRSAACLVAGRHIPFNGEVGRFRDTGIDLNLQQMSVGDCWTYKEAPEKTFKALLGPCTQPHTDQVVGFVRAPSGMSDKKTLETANDLCGNRFGAAWAPGGDRALAGHVVTGDWWNAGFREVICTVGRSDGKSTGEVFRPVGSTDATQR